MAKKKSNTLLYVGIICGAIVIIALLIFGFSTQWTFKPKTNKSNKKASNIEIGESLQYEDTPSSTSDDPIINEKVIIEDDGTAVVSKSDGTTIKTDTYTSQQGDVKDEYARNMTNWHNEIRGKCNEFGETGDLEWNDDLAKQATAYAIKLHNYGCSITQDWHYKHDNDGICYFDQIPTNHPNYNTLIKSSYCAKIPSGENLATGTGYKNSVEDIIRAGKEAITGTNNIRVTGYTKGWAGEGFDKKTGAPKEPTAPSSGHYTAMNWKSSKQLGCGTSVKNGCAITVCHYAKQPANMNSKTDNVMCQEPLQLS